jgi:hypothetical protein
MEYQCRLLSWYNTLRYGLIRFFTHREIITGHDFDYTGDIHNDDMIGAHWVMECKRCGMIAGTDVGPDRLEEI